jgi:penicillin-binding protein 2
MIEPSIYVDEVNQRQARFHRRAFLFGGVTGVGLLVLTGRLADLQILEAHRYEGLSEHNEFDFRLTPPPRGLILDRNGVVLASNRPAFRLLVATDHTVDVDEMLAKLAQLVPMDDARRARLAADMANAPRKATWARCGSIRSAAPSPM